ncbi:MAG: 30S ribosomal protein S19 [Candidatus Aenigmarchaeota archaeon]|nr:30S ribosomal protein S19 [Candidatus Aenigmarchaeota archaeon]
MADFKFKGKGLEDVAKMSLEDFIKLIPSRERRAMRRGFTEDERKLLLKIRKKPSAFHKTHCREMVIIPELLDKKIGIHNGKEFVAVDIKPEMLGHRLGEFALTRKKIQHSAPGFGATKSSKFIPLK